MYGLILTTAEHAAEAKEAINGDYVFAKKVSVYAMNSAVAGSEMLRMKDFVMFESTNDLFSSKLVNVLAENYSGIRQIIVLAKHSERRCTIMFRTEVKSIFNAATLTGKMSLCDFLNEVYELEDEKKSDAGLRRVKRFFAKIGIFGNLEGHSFLLSAVQKCVENPKMLHKMNKSLYPAIAAEFNTNEKSVEKNIRTAISVAFNRGKIDKTANARYGTNFGRYEKPTNGEFISLLAMIYEGEED